MVIEMEKKIIENKGTISHSGWKLFLFWNTYESREETDRLILITLNVYDGH